MLNNFIAVSIYIYIYMYVYTHTSVFLSVYRYRYIHQDIMWYTLNLHNVISLCNDILWRPRWHSGKKSACQCRRHRRCKFDPWIGKILQSRKWQPTPVFLPGKLHGWRSLAGYSSWGHKELDTTELLSTHTHIGILCSDSMLMLIISQ